MIHHARFSRIRQSILLVALAVLLVSPANALQIVKELAPGVAFYQEVSNQPDCELITNFITVDIKKPDVSVKAALAKDVVYVAEAAKGREAISTLTNRKGALVGVNADFFPFTGDPLGICIVDGELVSEPSGDKRAAVAITKYGDIFFDNPLLSAQVILSSGIRRQIDGINRSRETNQAILYTPSFGESTATKYAGTEVIMVSEDLPVQVGKPVTAVVTEVCANAVNSKIPKNGMVLSAGGPAAWFMKQNLEPGDTLTIQFDIKSMSNRDWKTAYQAVGGGPWLVKNGQVNVSGFEENFKADITDKRHPRTAVGATSDGKLLIATVDGRQSLSKGATLVEMAEIMKRFGAVNAINLDGGGSTSLSVRGLVVNSPSGGIERAVANALLVYGKPVELDTLSDLSICGFEDEIIVNESAQGFITWGADAQMMTPNQMDRVVWGTNRGIGFVNQQGYFTASPEARKGQISALYGLQKASRTICVVEPPPPVVAPVPQPNPGTLPEPQPDIIIPELQPEPAEPVRPAQ